MNGWTQPPLQPPAYANYGYTALAQSQPPQMTPMQQPPQMTPMQQPPQMTPMQQPPQMMMMQQPPQTMMMPQPAQIMMMPGGVMYPGGTGVSPEVFELMKKQDVREEEANKREKWWMGFDVCYKSCILCYICQAE